MSWQAYVDDQICKQVSCKFACIAGLANGQIWAQQAESSDVKVGEDEIKTIATKIMSDPDNFTQCGIMLGGEKYICISAEKGLVRGRKNKNALCIVATNTCLLVAVCKDGGSPGQLNNVVEKLADYLRQNQY